MIAWTGTHGGSRRRPWLAAAGVGLPAVALVVYLIYGFYVGRQAQHQALERDELAHTQALSVSLDHFLSGLQAEVAELADGREVSAWFENAALGLSLEYGLRINLLDLETEFDRRLAHRLPGGEPIYARLLLLDADGRKVFDSREPRRDPGDAFAEGWTRPAPADTAAARAAYLPDADQVVLATECRVLDRHEGWLLAFVPSTTLHAQVQGSRRSSDARLWLAWDDRILGGGDAAGELPSGSAPPPGSASLLSDGMADNRPRLLSCARAAHFPLTVTRMSSVDGALASDPRLFLWGLAALAIVLMGLSGMVWWGQLRSQALVARLDTEALHARDLAVRQKELEREIELRRAAETDLMKARDAAEAASRAKSQFLANMSHEIRTPLNGVLGMTELVLDTRLDDEQHEQLSIALDSGRSLLTIINDILDMSSIEAGEMRLCPDDFDPRVELESIRRSFLAGARARSLKLEWELDPELAPLLRGDAARLRQVLVNLLGNALKFTEQGSFGLSVRVDYATERRQRLVFRVHDTGIGIAPDKQEIIFGAFQQADGSHTRRYGGTGLGLHISRRLVAMMGGDLQLEQREGPGSVFTFTLTLPVAARADAPAPSADPVTLAPAREPLHVLVAEDNQVNQKLVVSLLEKWGHKVTLAADGEEALAALHAGTFDAVLLDLQMPKLDGIDVARTWRAHEAATGRPRLPLVALTARALPEDQALCLDVGMDAHLPKPLNSRALRDTLDCLVPAPCSGAA
jgi:signal transduction histidine kinase